MKITENVTVYKCDHCPKKLFRKNAMVNHEARCSKNPTNIRACHGCTHLEQVPIDYEPDIGNYFGQLSKSQTFMCTAKKTFMFPISFEYSGKGVPSYVEYEGEEIIQEAMPINCELKKDRW